MITDGTTWSYRPTTNTWSRAMPADRLTGEIYRNARSSMNDPDTNYPMRVVVLPLSHGCG